MPDPDDDREIADASFLFDDRDEQATEADRRTSEGSPSQPPPTDPDLGGYDLADHGATRAAPPPTPAAPVPPVEPPRSDEQSPEPTTAPTPTPSPVDHPWSRLSEWGADLARIGGVALVTAVLAYLTSSLGLTSLSFLLAVIGLAAMVLLSYPIAITLERPVRMTPEHALRDFYGALSHHLPHYRRTWLLLSSSGKTSNEFRTYGEFRDYWVNRLAALKAGKAGTMSPVSVRIEQFKSEKSAGQEAIEATYTLSIFLRGREDEGPLHAVRTTTTLSRGPDRMWYLDDGTLPRS